MIRLKHKRRAQHYTQLRERINTTSIKHTIRLSGIADGVWDRTPFRHGLWALAFLEQEQRKDQVSGIEKDHIDWREERI